jgi:hypothetical protein
MAMFMALAVTTIKQALLMLKSTISMVLFYWQLNSLEHTF